MCIFIIIKFEHFWLDYVGIIRSNIKNVYTEVLIVYNYVHFGIILSQKVYVENNIFKFKGCSVSAKSISHY